MHIVHSVSGYLYECRFHKWGYSTHKYHPHFKKWGYAPVVPPEVTPMAYLLWRCLIRADIRQLLARAAMQVRERVVRGGGGRQRWRATIDAVGYGRIRRVAPLFLIEQSVLQQLQARRPLARIQTQALLRSPVPVTSVSTGILRQTGSDVH